MILKIIMLRVFCKYMRPLWDESLQNIYSNAEYERVYGKSLTELESEWRAYLDNKIIIINYDDEELIDLNEQIKYAYQNFFSTIYTSPNMIEPYLALDQARLAMLGLDFSDSRKHLAEYYSLINR